MPDRPIFSIVSAVYDVLPYLDDFIASIEAQTFPAGQLEVIVVDDGSTDGSAQRLERWRQARPELVTVLTKSNGGQASARNLGLEHARGEWVTFTDPDDMLEPDALHEVSRFIDEHPSVALVGINRELWFEADDRRAKHPLHRHFEGGQNRLRDLDEQPRFFFGSAPAAFFRRAEIERQRLTFRDDIRPSFEDGYFCCEYLLSAATPTVGFVASAGYVYRKRGDDSSTLSQGRTDTRRYTSLLKLGYLGILDESVRRRGSVPGWLQTYILYELSFFLAREQRANLPAGAPLAAEVHEVLRRIAAHLDERSIYDFSLRRFAPEWRDLLAHGLTGDAWCPAYAVVDRVDLEQQLVRVTYRYTGDRPDEALVVDGRRVVPVHEKTVARPYFHAVFVRQRVAWIPYGAVEIRLNGRPVDVLTREPGPGTLVLSAKRARDAHVPRYVARVRDRERRRLHRSLRERVIARLARSRPVRRYLGNAWVLVDGAGGDAAGSAEQLFRHLRASHRDVNAWLAVDGTVSRRLRKDGHRRVVSSRGPLRTLLLLNCEHVISSRPDASERARQHVAGIAEPGWRFTLVPDRVVTEDRSLELNRSRIDVLAIATPAELRSVAGDDTGWEYTSREARLTGLPRFDLLHAAGPACPPERRDLVVVATGATPCAGTAWPDLTAGGALHRVATQAGARVVVLGSDDDVPQLLAHARVVLTGDLSLAFDAAYLDRPVVYFAPEACAAGGWFDLDRDGVGPVTTDPAAAVDAVAAALAAGPDPAPLYAERAAELFPVRDGRAGERVVAAIGESVRRAER